MLNQLNTEELLDLLDVAGVKFVTLDSRASVLCYNMCTDDSDWITFHKTDCEPRICDKLEVCDYQTTKEPVYKDWYMTTNYHS